MRVYRLLERNVLRDLFIKEEQIRLSQQTQQLLSTVEDRKDIDWMDVIVELPTKLIKEAIGEDATENEIQLGLREIFHFNTCLCHWLISNVSNL